MRSGTGLLLASLAAGCLGGCSDHVTRPVTVLPAPTGLASVSLSGAIHLDWSDNSYAANPAAFNYYQVYSTSYSLDSNLCGTSWSVEGTTVAPTFLVGAMTNGVPRCFAVSAFSTDGAESDWSAAIHDTPRPDARNVIVFTPAGDPNRSGFRFWLDANGNGKVDSTELGLVVSSTSPNADFTVQPSSGQLLLTPARTAVQVERYGTQPVPDLTDIDFAPAGGYGSAGVPALIGYGYVFQINPGDGFYRYGGLRVTAVGANYVIFDWSYQTDPGNPELLRTRSAAARR